jgi:H+/Cl- antiporter ClcA
MAHAASGGAEDTPAGPGGPEAAAGSRASETRAGSRGSETPAGSDASGWGEGHRPAGRHRSAGDETAAQPTVHALAVLAIPAAVVGIASSLALLALSYVGGQIEHFLWTWLPRTAGISSSAWYWILGVLAVTGLAVGLVVRYAPGHAGPDPATLALVEPPFRLRVLPSLLVTTAFGLGGGVSLGPENPITATNVSLASAVGVRVARRVPPPVWTALAVGGTVGALLGTPVAAALLLSEVPMGRRATTIPLWDRLFGPVVAAGAGALTTMAFGQPSLALHLAPYPGLRATDLFSGAVIAVSAVVLGLLMIEIFDWAHRVFGRLRPPVVRLVAVGLVLGGLGIAGGQITLFKGLTQMSALADTVATYTSGGLLVIVAVKMAALVASAAGGFRGGRIFPSLFIGVALGLLAATLVPAVPMALAVAAAVVGFLVAVTRSGWLSLFLAVAVANDITLLPLLCLVLLPVWLIATGRPEMQIAKASANPDGGSERGRV